MRSLFFYGSLQHLPLLEIVLGKDVESLSTRRAVLPGFRVHAVSEGPFPTLIPDAQASAQGIVAENLSIDDLARLDFYEGGFDYDLVTVTLEDGSVVEVYRCAKDRWTPQGDWSLTEWQAQWGEMSCHAAREVMGYLGQKTRDDVAAMFGPIRARAWSRVNAATSHHGDDVLHGRVEISEHSRVYSDFYALDELTLSFEQFDGSMSKPVRRAVFVPVDAAFVLPYDPVRDVVMLIEQARLGPVVRGDSVAWQYEAIAGRIDPGETPQQTARREAQEEANVTVNALHAVCESYPTAGNSTEFFYMYVGISDLPESASGIAGLESEAENIRSRIVSFDTLMALCDSRQIANMPLLTVSYWLARHRPALRSQARTAKP